MLETGDTLEIDNWAREEEKSYRRTSLYRLGVFG